jgi:predicted amidohydrolase
MAMVLVEAGEKEETIYAELEGAKIDETRKSIPIYEQRRFDVYPDVSAGDVKFEDEK